jgi:uncharacterized protein
MRVVLDSNILARAVYSVGGPAEEVVQRLTVPPHLVIISDFLLAELRRILHYPRLKRMHGFDNEKIEHVVTIIETAAVRIEVREDDVVRVVPDDLDDDYIVAAAVSAGADILCTRNRHFYHEEVIAYCRRHAVEIMDDVELLARLRENDANS